MQRPMEVARLAAAGLEAAGLAAAGLPAAGLETAGLETAGLETAGLETAGREAAALLMAVIVGAARVSVDRPGSGAFGFVAIARDQALTTAWNLIAVGAAAPSASRELRAPRSAQMSASAASPARLACIIASIMAERCQMVGRPSASLTDSSSCVLESRPSSFRWPFLNALGRLAAGASDWSRRFKSTTRRLRASLRSNASPLTSQSAQQQRRRHLERSSALRASRVPSHAPAPPRSVRDEAHSSAAGQRKVCERVLSGSSGGAGGSHEMAISEPRAILCNACTVCMPIAGFQAA